MNAKPGSLDFAKLEKILGRHNDRQAEYMSDSQRYNRSSTTASQRGFNMPWQIGPSVWDGAGARLQ
jgi:hypothetical protein